MRKKKRKQEKKARMNDPDDKPQIDKTIRANEKTRHCNKESSGNLQVSRKQDTSYFGIKEDLSQFYCFR